MSLRIKKGLGTTDIHVIKEQVGVRHYRPMSWRSMRGKTVDIHVIKAKALRFEQWQMNKNICMCLHMTITVYLFYKE